MEDAVACLFQHQNEQIVWLRMSLRHIIQAYCVGSEYQHVDSYIAELSRHILYYNPMYISTFNHGHFWDRLRAHLAEMKQIFTESSDESEIFQRSKPGFFCFNVQETCYNFSYPVALMALLFTLLDKRFHELILSQSDIPGPIIVAFGFRQPVRSFLTGTIFTNLTEYIDWSSLCDSFNIPSKVYNELIDLGFLYNNNTTPQPEFEMFSFADNCEPGLQEKLPYWSTCCNEELIDRAYTIENDLRAESTNGQSFAKPHHLITISSFYELTAIKFGEVYDTLKSELMEGLQSTTLVDALLSLDVVFPLVHTFVQRNLDLRTLARRQTALLFNDPVFQPYLKTAEAVATEIVRHACRIETSLQLHVILEKQTNLVVKHSANIYGNFLNSECLNNFINEQEARRIQETEILKAEHLKQLAMINSSDAKAAHEKSSPELWQWFRFRTIDIPAVFLLDLLEIHHESGYHSQKLRNFLRSRPRFTFTAIGLPKQVSFAELATTLKIMKEKYYRFWPSLFDESIATEARSRPYLVIQPQKLMGLRMLMLLEQVFSPHCSQQNLGPISSIFYREFMSVHPVDSELLSQISTYCVAVTFAYSHGGPELVSKLANPIDDPATFARYSFLPRFIYIVDYPLSRDSIRQLCFFLDSRTYRTVSFSTCEELVKTLETEELELSGYYSPTRAGWKTEEKGENEENLVEDLEELKNFLKRKCPLPSPNDRKNKIHFDCNLSSARRKMNQIYSLMLSGVNDRFFNQNLKNLLSGISMKKKVKYTRNVPWSNWPSGCASTFVDMSLPFWSSEEFLGRLYRIVDSVKENDLGDVLELSNTGTGPVSQLTKKPMTDVFKDHYHLTHYTASAQTPKFLYSKLYGAALLRALLYVENPQSYCDCQSTEITKELDQISASIRLETNVLTTDLFTGKLRPVLLGSEDKSQFDRAVFEDFFAVFSCSNPIARPIQQRDTNPANRLLFSVELLGELAIKYPVGWHPHPDTLDFCRTTNTNFSFINYVQTIQQRLEA